MNIGLKSAYLIGIFIYFTEVTISSSPIIPILNLLPWPVIIFIVNCIAQLEIISFFRIIIWITPIIGSFHILIKQLLIVITHIIRRFGNSNKCIRAEIVAIFWSIRHRSMWKFSHVTHWHQVTIVYPSTFNLGLFGLEGFSGFFLLHIGRYFTLNLILTFHLIVNLCCNVLILNRCSPAIILSWHLTVLAGNWWSPVIISLLLNVVVHWRRGPWVCIDVVIDLGIHDLLGSGWDWLTLEVFDGWKVSISSKFSESIHHVLSLLIWISVHI